MYKPPTLDTYYYHTHFLEFLQQLEQGQAHNLGPDHRQFIQDFYALDQPSQCLFIRMCNRKTQVFHLELLNYSEIENREIALEALKHAGFVRSLNADDYCTLLNSLKKDELYSYGKQAGLVTIKSSWPKAKIINELINEIEFEDFALALTEKSYFAQDRRRELDYLLFLYFGKLQFDLSSFTMRDLGLLRVSKQQSFSPRFNSVKEAQRSFEYHYLSQTIDTATQAQCLELYAQLNKPLQELEEELQYLHGRTQYQLAKKLEKFAAVEPAIELYALSDYRDSSQRHVRLLYNSGQKALAQAQLETILSDPNSDEDYYFAQDFYGRKFDGQKLSEPTSILRNAQSIALDEAYRDNPELGVCHHYEQKGWQCWHAENSPWRCLFGLLFWQELFCDARSLHSSFDRLPQILKDGRFAQVFTNEIKQKLALLQSGQALKSILATCAQVHSQVNGVFPWYALNTELIALLCQHQYCHSTASMIERMCGDYRGSKDGYPDLILYKQGQLKLIEVKAQGDAIRRNQLTRLKQLESAGFDCQLNSVSYEFNPEQTYVVVDLETTGGKKDYHRVTEIGAVKIRNHQVIGQWQSLINPQRHIPSSITQLTGISNAMVADAPLFSEIANELKEFLGAAVFVAHNVNFDYGFLSAEYQRLEQSFRYPKFCTVSNMRRHFPGLPSYSLGKLSQHFNIPLENHHRALDDAKAAGYLLNLINQKRELESTSG